MLLNHFQKMQICKSKKVRTIQYQLLTLFSYFFSYLVYLLFWLFGYAPFFISGRWSPLIFISRIIYELSNLYFGGSLVCVISLCRFLNLPITVLSYTQA